MFQPIQQGDYMFLWQWFIYDYSDMYAYTIYITILTCKGMLTPYIIIYIWLFWHIYDYSDM